MCRIMNGWKLVTLNSVIVLSRKSLLTSITDNTSVLKVVNIDKVLISVQCDETSFLILLKFLKNTFFQKHTA